MSKKITNEQAALRLWSHIRAWFRMNTALSVALRKGESARPSVVAPDDPFIEAVAWAFELGVQLKPIYDKMRGPARALITTWALSALGDMLKNTKIK